MQQNTEEDRSIPMRRLSAAGKLSATGSSNCSQSNDSEAPLSGSLKDGTSRVFRDTSQAEHELQTKLFRKFRFTRKLLGAVSGDSVYLCAAWALGSLAVIGLIFMLTFLIKLSSLDSVVLHDFISTNPILNNGQPIDGEQKWLHDFSHSVKPRLCHSHNDYWRPYPLFSALAAGCSSVEADVWHTGDKKDLLIGHDEASLTPGRTLTSMYLRPLLNLLDSINLGLGTPHRGIFRTDPNATLVLLIDVKSESNNTWPIVVEQLLALREKGYLTRYEDGSLKVGPITVVGTGNIRSDRAVFTSTNADPKYSFDKYHDTFLDAPLALLPQAIDMADNNNPVVANQDVTGQTWSNEIAFYASASFKSTIGSVITGFSPSQLSTLRSQINAAARLGLTSRYWDTLDWPVGYRDYVWRVLEREGVGILNVDDLEGAARRDWDATGGTWLRDVAWMTAVGVWVVSCGVIVVVLGWKQRQVVRARYPRRCS